MPQDRIQQILMIRAESCVGCLACATICPERQITVQDEDNRRMVLFERACRKQDCDRCVAACPEDALLLRPASADEQPPPVRLSFELRPCWKCAQPFTTVKVLEKLVQEMPPGLGSEAETREWLRLCPRCRRRRESENLVRGARGPSSRP